MQVVAAAVVVELHLVALPEMVVMAVYPEAAAAALEPGILPVRRGMAVLAGLGRYGLLPGDP